MIWDYTYYWSLLAPLFFAERLTSMPVLGRLRPMFATASALNHAMQALLRDWGRRNGDAGVPGARLLDQSGIDWFREMNRALSDTLDDDAFIARIGDNVARMQWLATEILQHARSAHPAIDAFGLDALLAGADPQRLASLSGTWYADAA